MEKILGSALKPMIILAAAVIALAGLKAVSFLAGPMVLAILFVAVLRPFYIFMLGRKVPNGIAVTLTTILFILILVFLGWVFSLAITETVAIFTQYGDEIKANFQALDLFAKELPSYLSSLGGILQSVNLSAITEFVTGLLAAMTAFMAKVVLVFFLFVFVLTGMPLIMKRMRERFGESHQLTLKTTSFLDNLARYFVLRTIVNAVTAVGIALGCLLLGIPDALVWALLTFVLSYIPYIGMFIACVPPGLIAFAQGGMSELAIFVVICVIVNGLAEQVLSPIVTGRGLSISPAIIFISFLFWGWLLGEIGYVVAVPMTLIVLLFMNSFKETARIAYLVSDIPE